MICVMRAVYQKGKGNFCCSSIDGLHVLLYARTTKAQSKHHQYCFVLLSLLRPMPCHRAVIQRTNYYDWKIKSYRWVNKTRMGSTEDRVNNVLDIRYALSSFQSYFVIRNIINDRRILFVRVGFGAFVCIGGSIVMGLLGANSVGFFCWFHCPVFFSAVKLACTFRHDNTKVDAICNWSRTHVLTRDVALPNKLMLTQSNAVYIAPWMWAHLWLNWTLLLFYYIQFPSRHDCPELMSVCIGCRYGCDRFVCCCRYGPIHRVRCLF